jgi:predicted naringenin-chalcone synthase
MKDLFNAIDNEIISSRSKITPINSSTLSGMQQKHSVFMEEIKRLNDVLTDMVNSFLKSNDLSEAEIREIKDYIGNASTDFITKSGVPGINPNFKNYIK